MAGTLMLNLTFDSCVSVETFALPESRGNPHDPRSAYVERFWLPVLGPSTTMLIRHLAGLAEEAAPPLALGEIAQALGLGERDGPNGSFFRTLRRAVDFDMVRHASPEVLAVRRALPELSRRLVLRLSPALRDLHEKTCMRDDAAVDRRLEMTGIARPRPARTHPPGRDPRPGPRRI